MDPISILGILISLGIAAWQTKKANDTESKLFKILKSLPSQLTENISSTFQTANLTSDDLSFQESEELTDSAIIESREPLSQAIYRDLDGDGREELIVQFPFGLHGVAMQVYGLSNFEFRLIAQLTTDAPVFFEFEDVNNDGRIEIKSIETNVSSGLPYVMGLRDEVWYQLESSNFVEVKRVEPTPQEIKEVIETR
ncbi:MAG: VCBS repeat-containing protein [Cyanobacteria bacterium J06638_20]